MMPADYNLFADDFRRDPNHTWIMKPAARGELVVSSICTNSSFSVDYI